MVNKFKFVLILLIVILLLPSSNFQAKNTMKIDDEKEPTCIGKIYGRVGNSKGMYFWQPYLFAKVDAELKQTKTGILGWYRLFLPVKKYYNLTAYKSGFEPITKMVYLSENCPNMEVNFDFFESEPLDNAENESPKPIFYGLIFGRTCGVFEHANWLVGFTKISFENRTKISRFNGFYVLGFLEIDKKYSITVSKEGYYDSTIIIKLTAEKPIQRRNLFMHIESFNNDFKEN